jgi:hypothetical protein
MRYGGIEPKIDFAGPVFDRVRFMHGRIGSSCVMQKPVGETLEASLELDYVQHFVAIWKRTFEGFLKEAKPGDYLPFAPELLQPGNNYALTVLDEAGQPRELSDRWQEALVYCEIAKYAWKLAGGKL